MNLLCRLLFQCIDLIRKPQDLFAMRDKRQVEDAEDIDHAEATLQQRLFPAIEEELAGRVLSDLLVGQVDQLVMKRHRQRLAAERACVKTRSDAA